VEISLSQAQADMREGYCDGGAGVLASALAWSAAAGVAVFGSTQGAVWTLLVGGALIHPAGVLLCRMLGARGAHSQGNPLAQLAAASTVWLVACLPLAYLLGLQRDGWFFSAMLVIVGGRYTVFATLYRLRLYWVLGLLLTAAGLGSGYLALPAAGVAAVGAAVELAFAGIFLVKRRGSRG
jgi:hypothetical protein